MGLRVERVGDVVVLVPKGMLSGGRETDKLERTLRKLVDEGQKKILLDLAKSTIIGNGPLGTLVSIHVNAAKHNLHFFICNVDRNIKNFLVITKLMEVLQVLDTREDALQALAKL